MEFENKHVIVTGGAKGIGGACSEAFVKEGANVLILDVDEEGDTLANKLGEKAYFIRCDVSKAEEVEKAITAGIDHFGDVDVLVNNVGVVEYGTVTETTEDTWDWTMNINVKAAFLCSKSD